MKILQQLHFELANLQNFILASEEELDGAKFELQYLEEKDVSLQQYVRGKLK